MIIYSTGAAVLDLHSKAAQAKELYYKHTSAMSTLLQTLQQKR